MAQSAPDGFEYTGEFRIPLDGEWYEDDDEERTPRCSFDEWVPEFPVFILRPGPQPALSPAGARLMSLAVTDLTGAPRPPVGWKLIGRGEIPMGGTFMASGDRRVWKRTEVYPAGLYAWRVEEEIPRPDYAPYFTSTGEYRIPKVGEWFLAKGGLHGPIGGIAQAGDPVKLAIGDVVPDSPRWIVELHKDDGTEEPDGEGDWYDDWYEAP